MSVDPTPPQASEPVLPASADDEDLLGVRCGAALIDLALLSGLFIVLSVTIGEASVGGGGFSFSLDSADASLLFLGLVLVYYFALEATVGQTVGKALVGLRVVHGDGDRPSVGAVAIRTLLRVVDWLPLLYLVGFITMLATGARQRRLGDLAAKTGIARAVPLRHRDRAVTAVASTLVLVVVGSIVYVAATDEDEGAKTYRGHGVSFDYPARWGEGRLQTVASAGGGGNELWSTTVGLGDMDIVSVTAYRLNIPVTAQNLDSVTPELASVIQQLAEQLGGAVQGGPEQLTVAGLPGARFRITGTMQGGAIQDTLVFAFDDTTEYFLSCQHTAEKAEEIKRGCEQILRTFKVD